MQDTVINVEEIDWIIHSLVLPQWLTTQIICYPFEEVQ